MSDKLKHWGIWDYCDWMQFEDGEIFWTTSRAVAEAQLRKILCGHFPHAGVEVREFEEE